MTSQLSPCLLGLLSTHYSLLQGAFELQTWRIQVAFAFEKLLVYQKSVDFADAICDLTEKFPPRYNCLADQVNRASLSISSNIAEGNGRFTKPATFMLLISLVLGLIACARHSRQPSRTSPVEVASDRKVDCYASLQQLLSVPAIDASNLAQSANFEAATIHSGALRIPTSLEVAADAPIYFLHLDRQAGLAFVTRTGGIGGNLNANYGPWLISDPKVTELEQSIKACEHQRLLR